VSLILTNVVLMLIGSVDVMDRLHCGRKAEKWRSYWYPCVNG